MNISSLTVVFFLVNVVIHIRQCAAVSCHSCSGYFNMAGDDSNPGCGLMTNAEIATDCISCSFGVTSTDSGYPYSGLTAYFRSCNAYGTVKNYSYNTCDNIFGDTCTCNSDLCNNIVIKLDGALDCYYCTSATFFDTGCGPNVNTSSPYVYVMKKCFNCASTYISPAVSRASSYIRGGSRFTVQSLVISTNSCQSIYGGPATAVCTCATNLCNGGSVIPANNTNQNGSGGSTNQEEYNPTSQAGGTTEIGQGDATTQIGQGGGTTQIGQGGGTTQIGQGGGTTQIGQGGGTTQIGQGGGTTQIGQGGGTTQIGQGGGTTQIVQGGGTMNVQEGGTTVNSQGGGTSQTGQGGGTTVNSREINNQTSQGSDSNQNKNGASTHLENNALKRLTYLSLVACILLYN